MNFPRFWVALVRLGCLVMSVRWLAHELKTVDGSLSLLAPWQVAVAAGWDFLVLMAMGLAAGTLAALLWLPLLLLAPPNRNKAASIILTTARILAGLLIGFIIAQLILLWGAAVNVTLPSAFTWLLRITSCLVAVGLLLAQHAPEPGQPDTGRRTLLALGAASASLIALGAVARPGRIATPSRPAPAGAPNILFVTFDSLSARDMSLYGYSLPTTPRLAAFAKNATVFDNFYSCSTFTTPSIASIMTGRYPSETGVYHLQGVLREEDRS